MDASYPRKRSHARVYWQVDNTLAIGATEKAAMTSIQFALNRCRRLTPEQVHQRKLRVRLYLRHPITRFASVYAYFAPNDNFPVQRSRPADLLAKTPTLEQFTDAVLAGVWNEHWCPQLEQHDAVGVDEIYPLEHIDQSWPKRYPLTHQNKGRIDKPIIVYRLNDLENYYERDLTAWHKISSI